MGSRQEMMVTLFLSLDHSIRINNMSSIKLEKTFWIMPGRASIPVYLLMAKLDQARVIP